MHSGCTFDYITGKSPLKTHVKPRATALIFIIFEAYLTILHEGSLLYLRCFMLNLGVWCLQYISNNKMYGNL